MSARDDEVQLVGLSSFGAAQAHKCNSRRKRGVSAETQEYHGGEELEEACNMSVEQSRRGSHHSGGSFPLTFTGSGGEQMVRQPDLTR